MWYNLIKLSFGGLMKNVLTTVCILILSVILLSACTAAPKKVQQTPITTEPTTTVVKTPEHTPQPVSTPTPNPTIEPTPSPFPLPIIEPGAPDVIGIYTRGSSRTLIEDFEGKWKRGKDIYIFDVYATQKELLERNSHKALFEDYWFAFPKADDYKIGYCVKFTLDTGVTHKLMIRLPKDCPKDPSAFFYPYVEIYVYDNINLRPGVKFYHLEEKTTYPHTLMTSIKLTPGVKIDEVTEIELTTFIYKDNNDFDVVTGDYIGDVSYTIPVRRAN